MEELKVALNYYKYHIPDIYDKIKKLVFFKFTERHQLRKAVFLWKLNKRVALKIYGHPYFWDISQINDMSFLFPQPFNDNFTSYNNFTHTENITSFNKLKLCSNLYFYYSIINL